MNIETNNNKVSEQSTFCPLKTIMLLLMQILQPDEDIDHYSSRCLVQNLLTKVFSTDIAFR